jgi:hypothetical protein
VKENEGSTVAFDWDTETLLTELNISSLKLNQVLHSLVHPPRHSKGSCILLVFLNLICLNVSLAGVTLLSKVRNYINVMKRDDRRLSLTALQQEIQKKIAAFQQA